MGKAAPLGKAGAEGETGGAQPLSAEPKATREARGARRRRAGCARWLRLAGGGGESKAAIPGAGTAAVIYGR